MTDTNARLARDETCVRILAFIADREVTRTELTRNLFKCHLPAGDLDAALAELVRGGLIESETRPRDTGAGTPTTLYRATQVRQAPIVVEPDPMPPDAVAKRVAAPAAEPASIAAGRKLLAALTRLKSERIALRHELGQRRARAADALLDAELGDADAIDERDGFAAHEQRIETRLRFLDPSIATLESRFKADAIASCRSAAQRVRLPRPVATEAH